MKRVQFLCLAGAALLFAACSKDDAPVDGTNPPDVQRPKLYVRSIVDHFTDGDSTVYEYNADKTLKRQARFLGGHTDAANARIYYPQYQGGQLKGVFFTKDAADVTGKTWFDFTLNNKSQVIESKATDAGAFPWLTTFAFNSRGQLAELRQYGTPEKTDSTVYTYTWDKNNVSKVEMMDVYGNDTLYATITYTYYDKLSPFSYPTFNMYVKNFTQFYYFSENNVKTETYKSIGTVTTTFEYTYNSDNYPTHVKSTGLNDLYPGETIHETDITYLPKQ